ncbi:hypothetical protein OFB92_36780, partial [Escherichia coli]|nr:hypothetical protein [Escherichia coli]
KKRKKKKRKKRKRKRKKKKTSSIYRIGLRILTSESTAKKMEICRWSRQNPHVYTIKLHWGGGVVCHSTQLKVQGQLT